MTTIVPHGVGFYFYDKISGLADTHLVGDCTFFRHMEAVTGGGRAGLF
jgi:hypothetical protein